MKEKLSMGLIIICLLVIAGQIILTALGNPTQSETEKTINVADFAALTSAISSGAKTIQLSNDITTSSVIKVEKDVIIDLNGKTISAFISSDLNKSGNTFEVAENVALTITDTSSSKNGKITSADDVTISSFGYVNLLAGTVENTNINGERAIMSQGAGKIIIEKDAVVTSSSFYTIFLSDGSTNTTTLQVSGRVINTATYGFAIFNNGVGNVTISGGTVEATSNEDGRAIYNGGTGKLTIKDDAVISSEGYMTIYLYGGEAGKTILEIESGIVRNTSTKGQAISNKSVGSIDILGGTVETSGDHGIAILNYGASKITIKNSARVTSKNNELLSGTICLYSLPNPEEKFVFIEDAAEVSNTAETGNNYALYFDLSIEEDNVDNYYEIADTATVGKIYSFDDASGTNGAVA